MGQFEEYTFFVESTQKLSERRQSATQTFLTINTGIFTILAFLFKDVGIESRTVGLAALPLLVAGLLVCALWHRILSQYRTLIGWRYKQLRAIEQTLPDSYRLLTREWDEYYRPDPRKPAFTFSNLEQQLPMIFGALFGCALLIVVLWGLRVI